MTGMGSPNGRAEYFPCGFHVPNFPKSKSQTARSWNRFTLINRLSFLLRQQIRLTTRSVIIWWCHRSGYAITKSIFNLWIKALWYYINVFKTLFLNFVFALINQYVWKSNDKWLHEFRSGWVFFSVTFLQVLLLSKWALPSSRTTDGTPA